ncbi:MAG: peptidoglycan editing factor PgeF [Deltaproteobacteria bacterium]|nr:peptidoglycan editing factor PgeF [Deltaproteobacteria bacterium]
MLKEKQGIKYLSCPLLEREALTHGFLTRTGGVSPAPFESLNFDFRTDSKENILRNKGLIAKPFSLPAERLITLNQAHGVQVFVANEHFHIPPPPTLPSPIKGEGRVGEKGDSAAVDAAHPPEADAIVTCLKDTPIGVLTADCLPALLYDPVKKAVGAAHAGWRGALLKIAQKTVQTMVKSFGSMPKDIIACLGPHIRPCCYDVKDDIIKEFEKVYGKSTWGFFKFTNGSPRLDMAKAVSHSLIEEGLLKENICSEAPCTACENKLFFSYRKENGITGRQLSFIMINSLLSR